MHISMIDIDFVLVSSRIHGLFEFIELVFNKSIFPQQLHEKQWFQWTLKKRKPMIYPLQKCI